MACERNRDFPLGLVYGDRYASHHVCSLDGGDQNPIWGGKMSEIIICLVYLDLKAKFGLKNTFRDLSSRESKEINYHHCSLVYNSFCWNSWPKPKTHVKRQLSWQKKYETPLFPPSLIYGDRYFWAACLTALGQRWGLSSKSSQSWQHLNPMIILHVSVGSFFSIVSEQSR